MSQGNAHSEFMKRLADRRAEAGVDTPQPHPAPADPPPGVPTKSGTVNPPEAPAEAPTSPQDDAPAAAPSKPKRGRPKGAKSKTKAKAKVDTPEAAADAATARHNVEIAALEAREMAAPHPLQSSVLAAGPAMVPTAPAPAVQAITATDPMALVRGLLDAAKDGRCIVIMVIPNGS